MGNLVLELHPDPDNPDYSQKVYIYDASGDCIGSINKQITKKPNKLCFRFRKEYVIERETLLSPEKIARNEAQLSE